ncbi:hypothetical protein JGH11_09655 [Dysgonomonas sp. Marseille-P4677]|uniref:hypothetical protein n=1 Tax=Dysgonomonas sp. Marseille-P4677 TaxID=2364790 RepID=UPI001914A9E1|nr:hypothetical protein [Dysgonomonas sp. Marseille-P4677]MBK5721132.1 hypothetical protein [Dysgonomonas sp. Marseille-P4677]
MLSKGIRKHVSNPVLGLLPFIVFVVFRMVGIPEGYALIAGFSFAILGEILTRIYYKTRLFSITFYISAISIGVTFVIWFFTYKYIRKPYTYVVLCEVLIITLFMILRLSRTYIVAHFFRQKNPIQKVLMNEFYESAALIQYGLTLHVFGILLYRQFTIDDALANALDAIVFPIIPVLIILLVGGYKIYKISNLASRLRQEEWLPIVTEKGEVTGKIAKNVSFNMKNKFLHPVVRVALISDSKVYLQERSLDDILSPGKLDYPFEKYMLFNHEINLAARNSISHMIGNEVDFSIKFLLKYVFENEDTKRLIFLFIANVDDEDKIRREGKMRGKFWTVKQLEEGFADEIFGECFELEFEYLKNMVLVPSDIFGDAHVAAGAN